MTGETGLQIGLVDCGLPLCRTTWTNAEIAWEIDARVTTRTNALPECPAPTVTYTSVSKAPRQLLKRKPVDLLVIDHSSQKATDYFSRDRRGECVWSDWLQFQRPARIVEIWREGDVPAVVGLQGKAHRKKLTILGYQSQHQIVCATDVGGSVNHSRMIAIHTNLSLAQPCKDLSGGWASNPTFRQPRPMSNLLRPIGLVPRSAWNMSRSVDNLPRRETDPMPAHSGSWISDGGKARRLLPEELAKGLGVPKQWGSLESLTPRSLGGQTCSHIYEWIGNVLASADSQLNSNADNDDDTAGEPNATVPEEEPETGAETDQTTDKPTTADASDDAPLGTPPWTWKPPDLRPGTTWYATRVANLADACKGIQHREKWFRQGLADLERHRRNYQGDGIKELQLLWWEFPSEHWKDLREGCSMNFLTTPTTKFTANAPMDAGQQAIAGAFLDELTSLGVVKRVAKGRKVECNAALFCVPKAGQPGEWRVIADMKTGGQNAHIGKDPVFLHRPEAILSQLYAGGYTAVADASKFFYQFPTVPSERKYLGLLHPVTGVLYEYLGLPMGSSNSPAVAGRMGASFFRLLTQAHPELFGGIGEFNTWYEGLNGRGYSSTLGHGLILRSSDGLPAVKIFIHCDDFCVHGPTHEKTVAALNALMDRALDVGLLFNPKKVNPPSQEAKYCGFIYDTHAMPTIRIPEDKRDRAIAMIDYIGRRREGKISRLALSVMTGLLQSMVDASPSRMGQTFLRRAYDVMHDPPSADPNAAELPFHQRLYSCTLISQAAWEDLEWWRSALASDVRRPARYTRSGTLVSTWGDGSGTGAGGTLHTTEADQPTFRVGPAAMWLGQWRPFVHHSTSNYKEMRTLLTALELIDGDPTRKAACFGTTLFYFTDNSVTYFAVQAGSSKLPHLQNLVRRIKLLELRLGCLLEVVHVPGVVMIDQGTDDLSRGVWISPLHAHIDPQQITMDVFAGVRSDPSVLPWVRDRLGLPSQARLALRSHAVYPTALQVLHQHTVWCPPPETARQLLCSLLLLWTESPRTTSFSLVVPRILIKQWSRVSRATEVLGPFLNTSLPPAIRHPLRVPVMLVHIAAHVRCLPAPSSSRDRLDTSTVPCDVEWHREQAELLRGVLPTH
jgi:hypothetical protein